MVKEKNIPKIQKLGMWESNRSLKNFNSNCLQLKIQKHQKMNWGKKLQYNLKRNSEKVKGFRVIDFAFIPKIENSYISESFLLLQFLVVQETQDPKFKMTKDKNYNFENVNLRSFHVFDFALYPKSEVWKFCKILFYFKFRLNKWQTKKMKIIIKKRDCSQYQQKQPSRGVIRKRYSENMQQIDRRTPMPKCHFNKVF